MKNRILKGLLMGSMIFAMSDGYSSGLGGFVPGSGKFNFGSSLGQTNPPMTSMVKKEIKETISESQTQSAPLVQQKKNLNQSQPSGEQLLNSSKSKKNPGSMSNLSSSKKPETVTNTEVKIPSSSVVNKTTVKKTEVVNDEQVGYSVSYLRQQSCKLHNAANRYREIAEKVFNKSNGDMLKREIGKSTIEQLLDLSSEDFAEFINTADSAVVRSVNGNLMNMNVTRVLNKMQKDYENIKKQFDDLKESMEKLAGVMGGPATVEHLNNLMQEEVNKAVNESNKEKQALINNAVNNAVKATEDGFKRQIIEKYELDELDEEDVLDLVERVRNIKKLPVIKTSDAEDFRNNDDDISDEEDNVNVALYSDVEENQPNDIPEENLQNSQNSNLGIGGLFGDDDEFKNPEKEDNEEQVV